ncbi:PP2C family serine/threonine-protein phosphatase [Oscillatoria sp. HE19RPO]|uniref:PP2C family protein-serine/threonine phosphatase n=1 Tax=Oscillatoria sp. HE19RPO TaxID=2954806 RepID=UPI0020C3F7D4|nr:protein phosphatase 2C domain-containing protein [Oscillatoria sp. HE19RPO]
MSDKQVSQLRLVYDQKTNKGQVRKVNEDAKFVKPWPDKSALLAVVADGMGGQRGGKEAAKIAIDTFKELLKQPLPATPEERYHFLLQGFHAADQAIREQASQDFGLMKMGATVVAAIITQSECLHLYAGDCRFYHFSGDTSPYVTSDHTPISVLLKLGEITPEESVNHPMRSVVMSCLGGGEKAKLSVDPKWNDPNSPVLRELHPGDVLVLCSDGLHGEMSDSELQDFVKISKKSPAQLTQSCVDYALKQGGKDNISMVAIVVQEEDKL